MDWRHRKYYLIKFSEDALEYRFRDLKILINSIKFHSPYNHFKPNTYDGIYRNFTKVIAPQYMISCRKEEAEAVECVLRYAKRNDKASAFCEITKDFLGEYNEADILH